MNEKMNRKTIEPCLYNFLGYGNLNGSTWFWALKRSGAEIWRFKLTLEESWPCGVVLTLLWISAMYGRNCMEYH